jgi:formylglycine-generating enzyme required for sulfatase activity
VLDRDLVGRLRAALANPEDLAPWRQLAREARRLGRALPGLERREHLDALLALWARHPRERFLGHLILPVLGLEEVPDVPLADHWNGSSEVTSGPCPYHRASGLPLTVRRLRDGASMRLVPAGNAIIGSNDGFPGHLPARRLRLPAFYVDEVPVLVAAWSRFMQAEGGREPVGWPELRRYGSYPVVGVGWGDAQAYGAWVGARLPSENEWEVAARGFDGRPFPWGAEAPDYHLANYGNSREDEDWPETLLPVDGCPMGASPFGAMDMVGNAGEWCEDEARDLETQGRAPGRVVRGSRWSWSRHTLYCWSRGRHSETRRSREIGFRLVLGLTGEDASQGRPRGELGEEVPDSQLPFEARAFPDVSQESEWLRDGGLPLFGNVLRLFDD